MHAVVKKTTPIPAGQKVASHATAQPVAIRLAGPFASILRPDGGNGSPPLYPSDIRQFYGVNSIQFGSVVGDGTGQTIAVIDAYNDPRFVSSTSSSFSTSDLHNFDVAFGIPDPPSFSVIPEAGSTLPTTYDSGWAGETALDVEWSHAMAPKANIILVETQSNSDDDLITNGTAAARAAGATVVSMSFGGGEATSYDSSFSGSGGVTYVASTGDYGVASMGYPSLSPYVVAVVGTTIFTSDSSSDYGHEVVWNSSSSDNDGTGNNGAATGGGIASIESKPTYQSSETLSGTHRGVPDVSFVASPYTGVYVLDTSQSGGGGYYEFGGTSLSSPCWAGLIAIADQGRALNGQLTAMNGFSDTLPRLYQLPSSVYHDITSGNNTDTNYSSQAGYSAGTGYDLASGIGTPIANKLIPDLAGVATITGRVFSDNTGTGVYGGTDVAFAGRTVYLDLNNDGVLDNNEPSTLTNAQGVYSFSNEPAGGTVRLSSPVISGYVAIPVSSAAINYGATDTINFTYFPTGFATSATATNYTLQSDSTGAYDQILINGTLSYSIAKSTVGSTALSFSLTGTGDSFTIDATYGNPIPTGGVTLAGAGSGDAVLIDGTQTATDSYVVTNSGVTFDGTPFSFSNVSLLTLNPDYVAPSLSVLSGSVSIQAPRAGGGILDRRFSSISVASGARLLFPSAAAHSDRAIVAVSALSDSGNIDLGGNDMIVYGGTVAALSPLLASGFNGGTWTGQGISSAAAAGNTTHLTALGILSNNSSSGTAIYNSFDGIPVNNSAILVKYTYYGDANLDGVVDGSDYSRIDNGFLSHLTGWQNGDFNYDTHVDGSDYSLIDNLYNVQGNPL